MILVWLLKGEQPARGERGVLPTCIVLAIRAKHPSSVSHNLRFNLWLRVWWRVTNVHAETHSV